MKIGIAGRLAGAFLDSKLTPLLMVAALALGVLSIFTTPREEEPQIRVPMIDVAVAWPGADPAEIESRIVDPIERAMLGIAGVEHVYAMAIGGQALVTVRFEVGLPTEPSLVKVWERLSTIAPALPPGASPPMVEAYAIDDVPFLALTLWSERGTSSAELRPLAEELLRELQALPDVAKVRAIGGDTRTIRVEPDVDRLARLGISWDALAGSLAAASVHTDAGTAVRENRALQVRSGPMLADATDVERVVVRASGGRPIYVRDVATVIDGIPEPSRLVFFRSATSNGERPAVTIALAKRAGSSATSLAEAALQKVDELRGRLLPGDVHVEVTRNYGQTADEKSDELIHHLLLATLSVVALIMLTMGWRGGLVVAIAVPVTLALTLAIFQLFGYTLNRVTLFALIFSIGILVDDAIVVVENIERHLALRPGSKMRDLVVRAVDEIGNPTILATFTVIASILPMAFVRGLMGPYMRPIPTGASAAMLFSLAVAFIASPWASARIFRHHREQAAGQEGWSTRAYRRLMTKLVTEPKARVAFFAFVAAIFAAALALVALGVVKVKMLPFDNKSELQVLVDHDRGTPLEVTLETTRQMARALSDVPEVANLQIYAGTAAPFNFNGLVRHYFHRQAPHQADLQVNLVDRHQREGASHDLAKALRPRLEAIAAQRRARVKVIEIPPGPPVLSTMVAEVYGPDEASRNWLADRVRETFASTPGLVDVDDTRAAAIDRVAIRVDAERAALGGVIPARAAMVAGEAGRGRVVGLIERADLREPLAIELKLSAIDRSDPARRLELLVDSASGRPLPLAELARAEREADPQPIFHKDTRPVVYVLGDLAGQRESPVYAIADLEEKLNQVRDPAGRTLDVRSISVPANTGIKWDGEWQITYEVFRDLGLAFAVVLVLIAILVVGWFQSFRAPLAILLPIPLSLIGILPAHWAFGAFFTATSMIGFIAGAGIIVRNSIILVDFIELKVHEGMPLQQAVVEAGVVRFRPMLLTASAVVVGASVMLFDPIFQGLAISLMAGEVAATFLSRMAVPVVYEMISRNRPNQEEMS